MKMGDNLVRKTNRFKYLGLYNILLKITKSNQVWAIEIERSVKSYWLDVVKIYRIIINEAKTIIRIEILDINKKMKQRINLVKERILRWIC